MESCDEFSWSEIYVFYSVLRGRLKADGLRCK
jgi:hypothetical protein